MRLKSLAMAADQNATGKQYQYRRPANGDVFLARMEKAVPRAALCSVNALRQEHKLGEALFAKAGEMLQARGLKVRAGTIVDAAAANRSLGRVHRQGRSQSLSARLMKRR